MLRFLTAGESHGPAQTGILEGIPAQLSLTVSDIQQELNKRRAGMGRGGRGQIETDQVKILSGVRLGKTLGSPITLLVENQDFNNWKKIMNISEISDFAADLVTITNPRPGHADLAGALKYHFSDIRNVIERASARETIMRVAIGAVCKKLLKQFDLEIASHTIQIGNIKFDSSARNFQEIKNAYKNDPQIHCLDKKTSIKMQQLILTATKKRDTLGGVVEVVAHNVPPGLGSHVHWDKKLDGQIACAIMSIPSVKAVEIGDGISNSGKFGSGVHDEIFWDNSRFKHKTNRAGGIEGGISNGEDIVCRVYHKPLPTLGNPLNTVNILTKKTTKSLIERSDICVVPRAAVVSEAAIAYVLADAFLEKFGGDTISEIIRNFTGYMNNSTEFGVDDCK